MERISEADLYQVAAINAKEKYAGLLKTRSIVDVSTVVNAYASGFYMGFRFIETPRHPFDWVPEWVEHFKKQRPLSESERFTRRLDAAEHYMELHFNRIVPKNDEEIRNAVAWGFNDGAELMGARLSL